MALTTEEWLEVHKGSCNTWDDLYRHMTTHPGHGFSKRTLNRELDEGAATGWGLKELHEDLHSGHFGAEYVNHR